MTHQLLSSFDLSGLALRNRVVLAPMTRSRAGLERMPNELMAKYYAQRAGAGLLISEATVISLQANGWNQTPGIYTDAQEQGWRMVVDAVHEKQTPIFLQLWHCGRASHSSFFEGGELPVAPSALKIEIDDIHTPIGKVPYEVPRALETDEIPSIVEDYRKAAQRAKNAGFDGIEIHGAHGYLISQFLSAYSNQRTDVYGGSWANRYRFAHEVIQAVAGVIPEKRWLIFRISDWGVVDMDVSLFRRKEEYQEIIAQLSQEPLDAISVSTYDYRQRAFGTDQNMATITREKTSLPIMICGGIYDRATAEDALKDADIVLSAKSMLLNPNWIEDVRQGKPLPSYKSAEADIAYTETPLT